jgi:Uma2 family endonuclease
MYFKVFMTSATLVSAEEYLATSYRPDRELLDGELVERNVGEYDHSNLQTALSTRLRIRQREWNVRVLTEQRVQVRPERYRVPDVCIVSRDLQIEQVFTRPPLVCIEILSKDDSLRSMQKRVDDYLSFGVPNIWILDPAPLLAYVCSRTGFQQPEGGILEVPSSPIRIPLEDLFADLD